MFGRRTVRVVVRDKHGRITFDQRFSPGATCLIELNNVMELYSVGPMTPADFEELRRGTAR
jgi:hypothetical protein